MQGPLSQQSLFPRFIKYSPDSLHNRRKITRKLCFYLAFSIHDRLNYNAGNSRLSSFPSTMSRRQWTGLFFWFAAVSRVAGQTSNVTACVPSFEWVPSFRLLHLTSLKFLFNHSPLIRCNKLPVLLQRI